MFSFLQKKIALQAPSVVSACNWSKDDDWLAIGGTEGMLKVIKFADPRNKDENNNQGGLIENITLDQHSGSVKIITWN
jgi:WD repeat-containing protein 35